ncbi:MAG TPA: hypothetical protein VIJ47_11255 [Acidimicrobiales bacterium]
MDEGDGSGRGIVELDLDRYLADGVAANGAVKCIRALLGSVLPSTAPHSPRGLNYQRVSTTSQGTPTSR